MRLRRLAPAIALAVALVYAPAGTGEAPAPQQLGAAIETQRNLTRERPSDAGVWNDLGNLLALSGSLDEAESAYGRALDLDPARASARFNLALLSQERGDLNRAVSEFRRLLESDPGNARVHYQLGAAYESQGQRQPALEHYAQAFTLDPDLLFAENNPQIIENQLVTEALLRARRGRRALTPAPRTYEEPARITAILAPASTLTEAEEGEQGSEGDPVDGEATGGAGSAHTSGESTALAPGRGATATTSRDTPSDRVLDRSDLRKSSSNQVRGEAGGGAPASANRRRAGATITPGGRRSTLHQPPAQDEGGAFGIGQRSTGSLEWRLGPASEEPAPAPVPAR